MVQKCLSVIAVLATFVLSTAAEQEGKTDLKAALVGKWQSDDAQKHPIEFLKDGTAKVGFIKKRGKWLINSGKWTVSEEGYVEVKGKVKGTPDEGVSFKDWWNLKDGVLVGPWGPNKKMLKWVKVKPEEKK